MIWIDLTNLPHVLFFRGLIKELERHGKEVFVTARKISFIEELLNENKIACKLIGEHGKTKEEKLIKSAERVKSLAKEIKNRKIKIAIAKHSVELPRVAFGFGIPCIFICDNEYAEVQNKLTLALATKIISPEATDKEKLIRQGAGKEKIESFYGVCEAAHLIGFDFKKEDEKVKEIKEKGDYVVIRPEPRFASYFDAETKTEKLISLLKNIGYNIVFIPRENENFKDCINIRKVDSLSLIYHAKAVFSGGGTMCREAAVLLKPAFSFYPQPMLGVDRFLTGLGLMRRIFPEKIKREELEDAIESWKSNGEKKRIISSFENPIEVIKKEIEKI